MDTKTFVATIKQDKEIKNVNEEINSLRAEKRTVISKERSTVEFQVPTYEGNGKNHMQHTNKYHQTKYY